MAVKTFTANELLTSSDTNIFLANAGLVYVTSTTFSASSSVNIDSCFTATYTDYIVKVNMTSSVSTSLYMRLRASGTASTTGYYWGGAYTVWAGTQTPFAGSNAAQLYVANISGTSTSHRVELCEPQVATLTKMIVDSAWADAGYWGRGIHNVSTAYDGVMFYPGSGTVTGTITIYGYRKA